MKQCSQRQGNNRQLAPTVSAEDKAHYANIVVALKETLRLMDETPKARGDPSVAVEMICVSQ